MTKGVRSQFLVKLHDLLENPAHVDGFRWTSETTFQIVANDKLAVAALQPAWKFTNLSSFIRQLNYYGFERMSDRRRSAERNGTSFNAGWIIFTHPSGFFRQGRPDLLDQIVRKSRKGKPEAARPQRSSVVAKVVRTGPTPPSPPISPTTSISSLSSGNSHNSYSSSSSSPSSLEFSKPPMYVGAPDGSLAARRGMDGKASLADYASHAPYGHQFIYPSQYPNYYTGYYGYSPTAASFNHSGETNSPTLTQEFIPSNSVSRVQQSSYVSAVPQFPYQAAFGYPSVANQHPQSLEHSHPPSSVLDEGRYHADEMMNALNQPGKASGAEDGSGEEDYAGSSGTSSSSPSSVENDSGNKSTPPSTTSSPILSCYNAAAVPTTFPDLTSSIPSSSAIYPPYASWDPQANVSVPFMGAGLFDPYLPMHQLPISKS